MNLGGGVMGSLSLQGSTVTRKSSNDMNNSNSVNNNHNNINNNASAEFPAGLRVLVVDDDPTCLTILEKMLRTCRYEVTKTNRAAVALALLRENRNGFDVIISDVHMPDMDGFKLLEQVGLEMDLPVIMMSADDSKHVVMKGVTHGACDYLIKPVRIEALKNIWQHVVRKKKTEWKDIEQSSSYDEGDRQQKQDDEDSSPANEGNWKSSKRKGVDDDESEDKDDSSTLKKPRVVWSVELHQQFVGAVNQLGIDKAVPKKILELMNVPGLTRENVASHLQKYRLYLRRLSGVSQHQGGLNNAFMPQDSGFAAMSSLGGIDIQTLAATGQISAQTLAAFTRMTPPIKPGMSMPFVDQRNLFNYDNSKLRYGDGPQQQLSNVSKQMGLLHGIPTTMEPKQLAGLNQSAQSMGNVNMQASASSSHQNNSLLMQMMPQQSRGQIINENVGSQVSRNHSPIGQPMHANVNNVGVLSRNSMGYSPGSQNSSVVEFSVNQMPELPGNGFPLGSTPGITSMTSKGFNQDEVSSDVKGTRGYAPSYDVFSELQQHKSQDWQLQNSGMALSGSSSQRATSVQSTANVAPSVLVNQSFIPGQKNQQNGNALAGRPVYSTGLESQLVGTQNGNQNLNNLLVGNTSRVKAERVADVVNPGPILFSEHYGQEDLMSALLKQQQEGVVSAGEFDFDGYTLDNIPV